MNKRNTEVEEKKKRDEGRAEREGEGDVGRKLNVDQALNLSLIMCGLLNQQSP